MLDKLKVQINLLKDVFDEQTKEVQNNRNPDKSRKNTSKNDSVFLQAQQVEMIKVKKDDKEDERDLNAEEEKLLALFEENDQEIDGMLDIVIEKMDNIQLHA